jgi:two-component system sensor histidine kinase VicK
MARRCSKVLAAGLRYSGVSCYFAPWNFGNIVQMSELSRNEARFRALVNATSDVIYSMSPDWSVMEELDGRGFLKSTAGPTTGWREKNIHPADMDRVNEAIEEAIANKANFELEHRVLRSDGSAGWTISRAVPILDGAGEITEWFGAASDITYRKQAQHQQRLYEAVNASTPDLVYVFALDYTFSYANQALLSMWGKTAEQAIGRSLLENGYELWHAEMHHREIDHIAATGDPLRGEVSFPHAVLGERIYDYILTPVFNDMGEVEAVAGITRDVTERKGQELRNLDLNEELGASNEELNATNEELLESQGLLSQANSNLAQILDMLPASVVVIRGEELVVEMINDSNLSYWSKTREEVIGKRFLDILPDLADQPFAGQLRRVMETGEVIDVKESPVLFTMEDGSIRETYVDYTYQALSDPAGNRNGVLVMSFEITGQVLSRRMLEQYSRELRQTNAELSISNNKLAKSESRFKYLIHEAPVAIGVLHGRDLLIESANGKLLEVWGKSTAVIGMTLADALPEISEQPFLGILDTVFTSGEAFYASEIRAMLEHDGVLKELFFNLTYQPVDDSLGETADILVVAVDVTEQVNSRKQVEQAELTLRLAIEAANVGTWHIHAQSREMIASPRLKEIFGYAHDDKITLAHAIEQIHGDFRQAVTDAVEEAIATGANYDISYKVVGYRDKKVRWVRALGNLAVDASGEFSVFTGVLMDITDMKEDEMRKNDFIGMVSHELKTPLTSLNGYLQLLRRKAAKGEPMPESFFEQPLKQVRQMGTMINGFLNVSRLDSGKIHIEKSRFDVASLFTEVADSQRVLYGSNELVFQAAQGVMIQADHDKICQVLNNLISNAVKYSSPKSKVVIGSDVAERKVRIWVSDEGIGVREQDLPKLFERYYRVEDNSNVSGFGIGLYLSGEIVRRHGGRIWAESEMGKGSTFTFELPIA